ncbi:alpha/beta hydrolase-fold protein [Hydrogenophaga sp.]|uniref:alpha/beta hydrolase-fold protein n=1 Tax=Hydrogenophaga sp. TaxID=1904254 RepID=UPI0035B2A69A
MSQGVRAGQASAVLVLLPGAQMHPDDVIRAGWHDILREADLDLDLHVPDLHLDPAGQVDALAHLANEHLASLRQRYARLWLGGISLGGLLALLQAQRDPAGLQGLCLFAPYPGSRLTTNAIERAGGLEAWVPDDAQRDDVEFQLWLNLREGRPSLPTFLGFGRDDRFAGTMRPLAQRLSRSTVHEVPGGHDWSAWDPLWLTCLAWLSEHGVGKR